MDTIQSAAVIAAAGAAGLFFFGRSVWMAWRAGRWPHAQGTVTRSWTETVTREINPTDTTGPTTSRISVRVTYRYVVGGTAYSGDRMTFFPSTMTHGFAHLAREHRDRYAAGTSLDVRYDPRNPSDAVIEARIPSPFYVAVGLAAVFLITGLAGLIRLLVL